MFKKKHSVQFPFPVLIAREGRWFVAECPMLNIATQGRTEKEVRENMKDLISEYLADPHTPKKFFSELDSLSFNYISVPISKGLLYGQT